MEVKKSLVPAENDKIAVAGGVQRCPPIPDIYASTVSSHSFAEQMLIEVDIWIYTGEDWLALKAEMEKTCFHIGLFRFFHIGLSDFHLFFSCNDVCKKGWWARSTFDLIYCVLTCYINIIISVDEFLAQ